MSESLTEFLLARIAEDEDHRPFRGLPTSFELAECEAKRRIVEVVNSWRHEVVEDCWYTCAAATEERDGGACCDDARRSGPCDCGRDTRAAAVLSPLALPYADHPDYRQEWTP